MKIERFSVAAVLCFGVLLILISTGMKTFTLNGQALSMWQAFRHDPLVALLNGHPHGLRYLIYYPIFALAQMLHIPPNLVFGYACAIAFLFMSVLVGRIIYALWGPNGYVARRDLVIVAIFAMSMLMNGRLLLAYCGFLMIVFAALDWFKYRKWRIRHLLCLIFGVLLTGVSSGTLLVAMALVGGIVFIMALREPATLTKSPCVVLSVLFTLVIFAVPALIGTNKNLAFYGGDASAVVKMLEHGAGGSLTSALGISIDDDILEDAGGRSVAPLEIVIEDDIRESAASTGFGYLIQFWWAGIIVSYVVAWLLGWRPVEMVRKATPQENVIHLAIALAILGGFFGYSVLSMAIIPALIFASGIARQSLLLSLRYPFKRSI